MNNLGTDELRLITVAGTGSAIPSIRVPNDEFVKLVDTSDQWIRQRSGIETRYFCDAHENSATLSVQAAQAALESSGFDAAEIDVIICATVSPHRTTPANATIIQAALGCRAIPAFDLSSACAGFLFALHTAKLWLESGAAQTALVIGAEALSRLVDFSDRESCFLFGDGAGAVVLTSRPSSGGILISSSITSEGRGADLIQVPSAGRSCNPFATDANSLDAIRIQGREVFRMAVKISVASLQGLRQEQGFEWDEIDWFIPHQANLRILEAIADKLQISMERVFVNLTSLGNVGGASIPIALDQARRQGIVGSGQRVVMFSIGGGLSWGTALLDFV